MRFDIITIFPKIFDSYFGESILKRARKKNIVDIRIHNLRDFTRDKHKKVDDKPYGGGAGMVLQAEPILRAVDKLLSYKLISPHRGKLSNLKTYKLKTKVVLLSAKGKQFSQKMAYEWAKKYNHMIFISGRYEGIDERAVKILRAEEISIGPYILTDGDVAAMAVVSAVARLLPGAIRIESLEEESHWNLLKKSEKGGPKGKGLEYPHYTRPEVLKYQGKTYRVPKVLLAGDHKKIASWRSTHSR